MFNLGCKLPTNQTSLLQKHLQIVGEVQFQIGVHATHLTGQGASNPIGWNIDALQIGAFGYFSRNCPGQFIVTKIEAAATNRAPEQAPLHASEQGCTATKVYKSKNLTFVSSWKAHKTNRVASWMSKSCH